MKKILSLFALLFALSLGSCSESSDDNTDEVAPTGDAVVYVDHSRIANTGTEVANFTVMCGDEDVTLYSKIYMKGETSAMSDSFFYSTIDGKYEFYANYNNVNSTNTVIVSVGGEVPDYPSDPDEYNTTFSNCMMMLQFTGADCSWCPYMIDAIDQLLDNSSLSSKFEHVAVHSYYGYGSDVLYSTVSAQLAQGLSVASYPTVMFNMSSDISTLGAGSTSGNYDLLLSILNQNYTETAPVGISAATVVENGVASARVCVKAAAEGDYSVGMFLVENGVSGYQIGYSDNIEHINAFRGAADRTSTYNFAGSSVGTLAAGESGSVILDLALDDSWNLTNSHLLIYVTTPNENGRGIVQNVVRCEIGSEVAFSYAD